MVRYIFFPSFVGLRCVDGFFGIYGQGGCE